MTNTVTKTVKTVLVLLPFLLLPPLAAAQEPQTCEAGFRLFDHELLVGEPVCIPENPERCSHSIWLRSR